MKFLVILVLATAAVYCQSLGEDAIVAEINARANGLWVAKVTGNKEEDVRHLLGVLEDHHVESLPRKQYVDDGVEIPTEFDSRKQWPQCTSIGLILDQGNCRASWAMAATGAMSDRLCIHKDQQVIVSAYDVLTCCTHCAQGCHGGMPATAWDYWQTTGIASGGLYGDNSTCRPYGFPHCDHYCEVTYEQCSGIPVEQVCVTQCFNGDDYNSDKSYGSNPYYIEQDVEAIQQEIMTNGPVEASITVHYDFHKYTSGIYKHVWGEYDGLTAVRIIGWGEEEGTPYWLVASSWNENWGENGLFRILRGSNESEIEENVVAALPN